MFLRSKELVRCDQLLTPLHTLDRRPLDLTGRGGPYIRSGRAPDGSQDATRGRENGAVSRRRRGVVVDAAGC